jgi:hypothetical protein
MERIFSTDFGKGSNVSAIKGKKYKASVMISNQIPTRCSYTPKAGKERALVISNKTR